MRIVVCAALTLSMCAAEVRSADRHSVLTDEEERAGFELLFNGVDLQGWEPKEGPWNVEDGAIHILACDGSHRANLACRHKTIPEDFELRFEWKEGPPGASSFQGSFGLGTFGALSHGRIVGRLWCEYGAADRGIVLRTYKISVPTTLAGISHNQPPTKDVQRPVGQWNEARMLCKGPVIQHWLNGIKILELDLRQEDWPGFYSKLNAPLIDQWLIVKTRGFALELRTMQFVDEFDVWYRRLKVRAIPEDEEILGVRSPRRLRS